MVYVYQLNYHSGAVFGVVPLPRPIVKQEGILL